MSAKVVTQLRPLEEDGNLSIVVLGRCDASVGEESKVFFSGRALGSYYVIDKTIKSLSDVNQDDLNNIHPAYQRKRVFWSTLEDAYKSGLPGEFEITFLYLSEDPPEEPTPVEDLESDTTHDSWY